MNKYFQPFNHKIYNRQDGLINGDVSSAKQEDYTVHTSSDREIEKLANLFPENCPFNAEKDKNNDFPVPLGDRVIGYMGKRLTVLVVDDRAEIRLILDSFLEPLGFKIIEASDGKQGLDRALTHHPDAIITDIFMPKMNGHELSARLRQLPEFKQIPIIAISATELDDEGKRSIYNDFLLKPIMLDELLEKIGKHLGLSWIESQDCDFPE